MCVCACVCVCVCVDLRWVQVNSSEEAYRVMKIGKKNQSFSSTRLNQLSSRRSDNISASTNTQTSYCNPLDLLVHLAVTFLRSTHTFRFIFLYCWARSSTDEAKVLLWWFRLNPAGRTDYVFMKPQNTAQIYNRDAQQLFNLLSSLLWGKQQKQSSHYKIIHQDQVFHVFEWLKQEQLNLFEVFDEPLCVSWVWLKWMIRLRSVWDRWVSAASVLMSEQRSQVFHACLCSHSIFSIRILRVDDVGVPRVLGISE